MFRKKTDEKKEILLQSFYNLEAKLTKKLGMEAITVAFTASDEKTNKTAALVTMARHLSEDGDRVLIIDANLRKSNLQSVTNSNKDRGFIDIILGDYAVDELIETDKVNDNVNYIYTGQVGDYADKYLEPADIKTFFNDIGDRYDYVFIDVTPNIDIPEANMFAANADGAVIFTTYELSNSPITYESIQQLEKVNANILGLIITDYIYSEEELDDLFGGNDE